ncbi:MAG: hypothetical protein J6X59_06330 [Bacteroidales bacterium]|nr:hypothetical protein [Bacteroidales bacterium]
MSRQIKTLMLCAAMVVLVACNNSKVANDTDSTDTATPVAKVLTEEQIKDSIDPMGKDSIYDVLPTFFDFMPREEYVELIKSAVRYDRDHDSITLDSAIEYYNDVPRDSIEKWWIQQ